VRPNIAANVTSVTCFSRFGTSACPRAIDSAVILVPRLGGPPSTPYDADEEGSSADNNNSVQWANAQRETSHWVSLVRFGNPLSIMGISREPERVVSFWALISKKSSRIIKLMAHGGKRPNTGGKRPGAGRKPGAIDKATALARAEPEIRIVRASAAGRAVTAAIILASVDEGGLWRKHLMDENKGLDALKYLTDRRDGKAVEYRKNEAVTQKSPMSAFENYSAQQINELASRMTPDPRLRVACTRNSAFLSAFIDVPFAD
jgi:hypothetical protein